MDCGSGRGVSEGTGEGVTGAGVGTFAGRIPQDVIRIEKIKIQGRIRFIKTTHSLYA
jgi:hypothetical protein